MRGLLRTKSMPLADKVTESPAERAVVEPSAAGPRGKLVALLQRCGIDRAIAYTLVGRGWGVLATPLTWFFITRWLRPEEQGFYYTFGSVNALNLFLELGLALVLVQFASHEKARLEWADGGTLTGSEEALDRLSSVLRIALKWYGVAAALVILVVLPAGIFFFSRKPSSVVWLQPWIFLTFTSAADLLILPLLAVLEGCGKIWHIASLRLCQSIAGNAGLWLTLRLHGGLFASPVYESLYVLCAVVWLASQYGAFFKMLFRRNVTNVTFSWSKEVWPFQWRIALSWIGGYFVSQIMNPVLFIARGPVVAGQMGMSLSICSALVGVSFSWMSTKASPFGVLVAKRSWAKLDELFFRTVRQSLSVLVVCIVVVFTGVVGLHHLYPLLAQRILSPIPFGLLLLASLTSHLVYCEALYLRSHKTEPFLVLSVVGGLMNALLTFVLAKPFGAGGVAAGNLACGIGGLVFGTWIFIDKRKFWHA